MRSSSPALSPTGFPAHRSGTSLPRVGMKHPKLTLLQPSFQTLIPFPPYLVTGIGCALHTPMAFTTAAR